MGHISDIPINQKEQTEQETVRRSSVLFPGFTVTDKGILNESSGAVIADVAIDFLGLSARAKNALYRWGTLSNKLTNGILMLSTLLQLTQEDIKGFKNIGAKTWTEIISTLTEYLSTGRKYAQTKGVLPTAGAVLPGWTRSDTKLIHAETGTVINDAPISVLRLNIRAENGLAKLGVCRISDFIDISYETLLGVRNLGVESVKTTVEKLNYYLTNRADDATLTQKGHGLQNTADGECLTGEGVIPSLGPLIPVLAEEYAVMDDKIIRRSDSIQIKDTPIEMLNLSVRGQNCLHSRNITRVSQLVGMPYDDFRSTRNLGVSTANEIVEKLAAYLDCPANEYGAPEIKVLPTDRIESYFNENSFGTFSKKEIPRLFADEETDDMTSALNFLSESGGIRFENDVYHRSYPSFFDVLEEFLETAKKSDQRAGEVMRMRAEGKTLEEIGQAWNITRERARQMENKVFNKVQLLRDTFSEDRLAYLFEQYALEDELLDILAEHNSQTVYYLEKRYQRGDKAIETALDDRRLPVELRRKIEKWLDRDYFFVGSERIHRDRRSIEDVVLRKYCADGCSFDEFCERYNRFLLSCDLPPEITEALLISASVKRTRTNRLAESRKLLRVQNQRLRYYDIASVDATELLETLDLGRFENIELSTRKFVRDYPDLMEKYDIRDEYELHNLLKKLDVEKENPSIHFAKMPSIVFGEFDREQVVKELLFELAPISMTGLAEKISEEYGHRANVVYANWLPCIQDYYHQGMFTVDVREMPDVHMALLREALKDDFYFFDDIKKIYRELLPDADVSLVSPFNLKRMGFRVNGTYIIQNFESAEAYFRDLFTCREIVDASQFHERFKNVQMYGQVLKGLKHDYTIIEFEPMQYINRSRLQKLGITAEQLRDFCDEVYAFVGPASYFTIEYLEHQGFTTPLDDLGFGSPFYISLLREDVRFTNCHVGHNILFYARDIHMKRSNLGNNYVSVQAFVSDYVETVKSTDIDEILSVFENEYNIRLDRGTIIEKCKDTSLYYDRIMEKLYINYDAYFEEI